MPELRWALLVFGVLFLTGLAWWEMRKPRRGLPRGDAPPELHSDVRAMRQEPSFDTPPAQRALHAALGPDFELPHMRAKELDQIDDDEPASDAETPSVRPVDLAQDTDDPPLAEPGPIVDQAPPARTPGPWPVEGERQILTLRVVPQAPARFGGRSLREALEETGYVHGVYGIYHQSLDDGQVISSAANLTRPGNFDPPNMDGQFFHGLNLFTVLPGPLTAERALEELAASAGDLAHRLDALVQDDLGRLLTAARLAELKLRLARVTGPAA
ncbi:MAG: cell division protein ZipA C-terminal FtsZ-binding domain-containing protein [Steroidobacteraceae bacterium]